MDIKALGFFLACSFLLWQPVISQDYFQQKVDYEIEAELDTLKQILSVKAILNYKNNSPEALDKIIFHLWLNAMKDKSSNFANQQLKMGRYDFYFSNEDQQGGYNDIDVQVNGKAVELLPYTDDKKTYSDIAEIKLKEVLEPGQSARIEINYVIKIPFAFDRPGLEDNLYQMTQWYPKPAVYDHEGWHPMPYLSLGEFYSEFGDYNVELTVPISYSVVGTGSKLESASKLNVAERKRTVVFKADDVHDFAWFASEYYIPYTDVIEIGERSVKVNFFVSEDNANWEKYMVFAKRALKYFSAEVGVYPYQEMTVVESVSRGSGMEYPMITILDMSGEEQQVDHLIAHEIGHNWFYGLLASNERRYAWIDEGLTSYFDHKYDAQYYDEANYDKSISAFFRKTDPKVSVLKKSIIHLERLGLSAPIDQDAELFDPVNYISMNYEKAAWIFEYLAAYMGEEVFEEAVKKLFDQWQFKHLQPDDLIAVFEDVSGKNVRQVFETLISDNAPIDFAVKNVIKEDGRLAIDIENKYNTQLPVLISTYNKDNDLVASKWFDANGEDVQTLTLDDNEVSKVAVNDSVLLFEINHRNNAKVISKISDRKSKLNFNLMKFGGSPEAYNVNFLPMVQHNSYDGFMLGMVAFSDVFPKENVSFYVNPNYAFSSKDITGSFAIQKDINFQDKKFESLSFGLEGRRYHYDKNEAFNYDLNYQKFTPYLRLNFGKGIYDFGLLEYKLHHIQQEDVLFVSGTEALVNGKSIFNVHQLTYRKSSQKYLSSSNIEIQLQYEKYDQPFERTGEYLRSTIEYNTKFNYNKDSRIFFRVYGAYFPINSQRQSSNYADAFTRGSVALTANGISDYTYEEYYFSRTGEGNTASSQIVNDDLGFKNVFETYSKEGMSNNYAFAINAKMDLPFSIMRVLKVRPYFDMALSSRKSVTLDPLKNEFYYSGGLALEMGDILGLYLPLFNSKQLNIQYAGASLFSKLSFKLNLRKLNPWRYAHRPGLFLD